MEREPLHALVEGLLEAARSGDAGRVRGLLREAVPFAVVGD
jgi:hypothetical protein